ncbi:hypothetical protein [Sorangium sp. So ce1024]|uniref:hypothetical protein n=1 Tax=Sorangium sp. So ce1024 TaxID=3133327 RepID=UPI003EFF513B
MLSVFVMSILPATAVLRPSLSAAAVDGGEGASIEADEHGCSHASSQASEASLAVGVGEVSVSIASCVVSCPGGDKAVSCSGGVCQCYCDPDGKPVCKCG